MTEFASKRDALEALGVRRKGGAGDTPVPYYSLEGDGIAPYPVPQPARYVRRWGDYSDPYNPLSLYHAEDVVFGVVKRSEETWGLAQVEGYGSVWLRWEKDKRRRPVAQAVGERLAFVRADITRGEKGWRSEGYYPAWMGEGLPSRAEREADKAAEAASQAEIQAWASAMAAHHESERARLLALHGPACAVSLNGLACWDFSRLEAEKWLEKRRAEREAAESRARYERFTSAYSRYKWQQSEEWNLRLFGSAERADMTEARLTTWDGQYLVGTDMIITDDLVVVADHRTYTLLSTPLSNAKFVTYTYKHRVAGRGEGDGNRWPGASYTPASITNRYDF